ncbi:signal transduction protein [Ectothiorhodospira sp. PHS-1]|uniref:HDOD domain-containing protein n=1 Tax=Ectothiorhodospira sp. PHS-1 TaxID=519989 RepID=UPI00024A8525|nr:HDOD domain-containing protein [Ectothiorhodospira sp. PHS-1]EHQ53416.1 signal transduction protein [Ectothiorhodospira sp. PHS-1]
MDKRQLDEWVSVFDRQSLPLLPGTRDMLAGLESDRLSSMRVVARLIQRDPGLALRVVRTANALPHRHFRTEVVSLDEAAMMIGIQGILRCLEQAIPLDQLLEDPEARTRYTQVAARAAYTALLAEVWGDIRHDMVPGEVSLAGLFYNLGELLLAAHRERRIQRYLTLIMDSCVLPHEAEYVALDLSLRAIGHRLAETWQLPEMVRHCMSPANARHLRTLGVMLAAKLAREAMRGWRAPGLIRDLRLAAEYLDIDMETLVAQLNRVSEEFNLNLDLYDMAPIPVLVPEEIEVRLETGGDASASLFCLAPRSNRFAEAEACLRAATLTDADAVLDVLVTGLHHGLGLNRVVFARLDENGERLVPAIMEGTDHEPDFNRFTVALGGGHLVSVLMKRPASFWLNPGNAEAMWPQVPEALREVVGVRDFLLHSLFVGERPIGMLYADRRSPACALDRQAQAGFNHLAGLAQAELLRLDQTLGTRPRPRAEPIRTLR